MINWGLLVRIQPHTALWESFILINADAKALEWLGVTYLSKDRVAYQEIREGVPVHDVNKETLGLPSKLIAKVFVFRLIFGGGAWSYANDPDFSGVGYSEKQWQKVIDKFYLKYEGIKLWHDGLKQESMRSGKIVLPTGREFTFVPKTVRGDSIWPVTTILNYPVQGFSADLMVLARCLLASKLRKIPGLGALMICTVHDSILLDVPDEEVELVCRLLFETWDELPGFYKEMFKEEFDLPCRVEVMVGRDWKNMTEVKDASKL